MAGIVFQLMFDDGLCEEEGTPIRKGADDAAVLEEEGTGFEGDFFNFSDVARPDHRYHLIQHRM